MLTGAFHARFVSATRLVCTLSALSLSVCLSRNPSRASRAKGPRPLARTCGRREPLSSAVFAPSDGRASRWCQVRPRGRCSGRTRRLRTWTGRLRALAMRRWRARQYAQSTPSIERRSQGPALSSDEVQRGGVHTKTVAVFIFRCGFSGLRESAALIRRMPRSGRALSHKVRSQGLAWAASRLSSLVSDAGANTSCRRRPSMHTEQHRPAKSWIRHGRAGFPVARCGPCACSCSRFHVTPLQARFFERFRTIVGAISEHKLRSF